MPRKKWRSRLKNLHQGSKGDAEAVVDGEDVAHATATVNSDQIEESSADSDGGDNYEDSAGSFVCLGAKINSKITVYYSAITKAPVASPKGLALSCSYASYIFVHQLMFFVRLPSSLLFRQVLKMIKCFHQTKKMILGTAKGRSYRSLMTMDSPRSPVR